MTTLFKRLGVVGVSLVAGALIFGAITGGIVVHRLARPAPTVAISGHGDQKKGSKSSAKSQDEQDQHDSQVEQQDSKSNAGSQSGSSKDKQDSD